MITLGVAVGMSLLVVAVAGCAAGGKLPLNGIVGIRTRQTMRTKPAWVAGHAAALPVNIGTAVITIGASVALFLSVPQAELESRGLIAVGILVTGLLVSAVIANRAASRV